MGEPKNPRDMTDADIAAELRALGDEWDEPAEDESEDAMGGSPGEATVERMGALEYEQYRRRELKRGKRGTDGR